MNTGVSVANSGFSSAACQLTAYTGSGEMARIPDISLGPGKQISQFLDELITDLPLPYQGSFSLDCEGGSVVPVALVQRRHDGFLATVAMSPTPEKESIQSERIDGALIYDRDPSTKLGNNVFGSLIADLENNAPGRCTPGSAGPPRDRNFGRVFRGSSCCPALSSKPGLMLLPAQVVRGSAGLGFVTLVVHPLAAPSEDRRRATYS